MSTKSPFIVPPFDPGRHKPTPRFFWWSWHPNYPYWSKSCWGGATEAEAWEVRAHGGAGGLDVYHNKMIREGDGSFTEMADDPCRRLDIWHKIATQNRPEHEGLLLIPPSGHDPVGCVEN